MRQRSRHCPVEQHASGGVCWRSDARRRDQHLAALVCREDQARRPRGLRGGRREVESTAQASVVRSHRYHHVRRSETLGCWLTWAAARHRLEDGTKRGRRSSRRRGGGPGLDFSSCGGQDGRTVHIDLSPPQTRRRRSSAVAAGATVQGGSGGRSSGQDARPEGNEFCVLRGHATIRRGRAADDDLQVPSCGTPSATWWRTVNVAIEGFTHLICSPRARDHPAGPTRLTLRADARVVTTDYRRGVVQAHLQLDGNGSRKPARGAASHRAGGPGPLRSRSTRTWQGCRTWPARRSAFFRSAATTRATSQSDPGSCRGLALRGRHRVYGATPSGRDLVRPGAEPAEKPDLGAPRGQGRRRGRARVVVVDAGSEEAVIRADPNRHVIQGIVVDGGRGALRLHPASRRGTTTATTSSTWLGCDREDPESREAWMREWVHGRQNASTRSGWATRLGLAAPRGGAVAR